MPCHHIQLTKFINSTADYCVRTILSDYKTLADKASLPASEDYVLAWYAVLSKNRNFEDKLYYDYGKSQIILLRTN